MRGLPGPDDLWGKFKDEAHGGPAWHPLVDHCADVAGVFEALLRHPTIRRRLARASGQPDLSKIQIARFAFLAFIHDLGKCAFGFRAKAVPEFGHTAGHLATLRPLFTHELGPKVQQALEIQAMQEWAGDTLDDYFHAVFAHHGRTPDLEYRPGSDNHLLRGWTGRNGEPLRRLGELIAAGRVIFSDAFAETGARFPAAPTLQHLFAGFLMLADWLGSNDQWFPYAEAEDESRAQFVRGQAEQVLTEIGLIPPPPPNPMPAFDIQFDGFAPRPAQAVVNSLPLPDETGSVVLLESETGSGKTEAAFRWASRLIDAGLVDGCYFAVPLRSAAVQLHGRMQKWLDNNYGAGIVEALLAVPGYFRMGQAEAQRLPDFQVQWTDADTTDRHTARWAAEQPKRYMAASFAVGTIDQALLGALAVKHAHLRAACLVRHLLVIDEVHASDVYMTTLVERLMVLFRAAGGHVLLMSATVGAGTRERLVYGNKMAPPLATAIATPYPRVSASHTKAVDIVPEDPGKTVAIDPQPLMDDAKSVAGIAAKAAGAGARVLVLRNTVKAAIETQEALEALLLPDHPAFFRVGGTRTLHHGRFAAEDRQLLDDAVETRFGKHAPPGSALIVATQTLEQSLDVDADLMITDLAPIDILLQRIGRLHRHARNNRTQGYTAARCLVLLPDTADLSSFIKGPRQGIGPKRAYDNVLAVEAARQMVVEAPIWSIPTDNRRLVEKGTHEEWLRELADGLGVVWRRHWQDYFGSRSAARNQAKDNSLDFTGRFSDIRWPESAERIATRLGARDLLLPLDSPMTSPFGALLKHLKIPAWMAPELLPDGEPVLTVVDDHTIYLGEACYRYDRFGIVRA